VPLNNFPIDVVGITIEADPTALKMDQNLSDLVDASAARTNLDVYDTGTTDTTFLALAGGAMTGAITFDATGLQNINKGTFDNSLGGYNGISLTCAVGYELNWQGGHLGNWYSGAYSEITIDSSVHITHVDGLTVESGMTVKGPMISDESATSGFISTLSGAQLSFDGTGCYISGEETTTWGLSISNCPAINFADSTSQSTAAITFSGGTVGSPISVTGSGGTISMGDSIGFDLSGSTAGAGIKFADSTIQYTAAVAPPSADVLTANAIASNINYISGSSGTWVGNGLPTIAGLIGWGVYNVTDGLIAYSYSSGPTFYLASAISTSNDTVQVSGSNSSFYIA
jgi:hypothetical protein